MIQNPTGIIRKIALRYTNLIIRWEDEREDDDEPDEGGPHSVEAEGVVELLAVDQHGEHHEAQECVDLRNSNRCNSS